MPAGRTPSTRHKWGEPNRAVHIKTERSCTRCQWVRVTRKDNPLRPWVEFYHPDVGTVAGSPTPPCGTPEARA